jgi:HEAT repeat protein
MGFFKPNIQKMRKRNDVASLIKVLENETDLQIRQAAVEALGEIGNASAVKPLYDYLVYLASNIELHSIKEYEPILESVVNTLGKIGVSAVEPLCSAMAQDKSKYRYDGQHVVKALVKIGVPAVKPLCIALKDSNRHVRETAVFALGSIGDARAVEALCNSLDDEFIAPYAIAALGKIGAPALESLSSLFKESDDAVVRANIISHLDMMIENEQAFKLICLGLKDRDLMVRERAINALEKIGNEQAVEPLISALRDSSSYVRHFAAKYLEKIGLPPDFDPINNAFFLVAKRDWAGAVLLGDVAVEPLCAIIVEDDESKSERLRNLAISKSVYEKLPFYLQLKNTDPETEDERIAAIRSLEEIGDARAIEPLCAALKDTNKYVSRSAAKALGRIGDVHAAESIAIALKDSKDDETRSLAAEALGKIGVPAVEPLITALKDENSNARRAAAAQALGKIGDARAVEPLIAALKDKDNDVYVAAAEALGKIGDDRAVEPLITEVKDMSTTAAEALGAIGDARAVEPLIAVLKSGNFGICWKAAEALGKIGDDRAVEPLIALLKDEHKGLEWYYPHEAAAEALGKIGDARAVEPLVAALTDKDEVLRKAAAEALGAIGDARAVEPLTAALKDVEKNVREAAAEALRKIDRSAHLR